MSTNLPVSTSWPQSSIALLAKLSWDLRNPTLIASCSAVQPNQTRHAVHHAALSQTQPAQRPGSPSRSTAEHPSQRPSVIIRSSEYSVRFHAYIRERSSLISRSKDAEAVSQEHSIALLLIAASERARSCSPGIAVCRTSCRLHQAQLLLHACSQALSVTQSCTVLVGYTGSRLLIRPGPRKLPFRTPSWVRAPLPAFTGPVGLHTYRQGAKLSQHSAACSILGASRGPGPCRPRNQQGAIPQHHRLHRRPPRSTTLPSPPSSSRGSAVQSPD